MLTIEPIPAFNDNYIWLLQNGSQCAVVDPGDATPVLAVLQQRGLTLTTVLITHHHFDHVGGLPALIEHYQPVVYGPENPAIESITCRVVAGAKVDVLGAEFSVFTVPGHTLDHIAFYHAGDATPAGPTLFCGDTLFAGGCGRMFEGTAPVMLASLSQLANLPSATRVYCAHEYTQSNLRFAQIVEPDNSALDKRIHTVAGQRERSEPTVPSSIAVERATNPFLRCAEPALIAALKREGKWQGDAPAAVFAALRSWKDSF
jgi:hydroxyacylglutathione hydrolase